MKTKRLAFLLLLFILPTFLFGQRWRMSRSEILFGTGTNNFMGDLGGGAKDAAHFFGMRDIDLNTTRPTLQLGYRYKVASAFAVQTNLTYARLSADDANSGSIGRQLRNLSFVSNIWEAGVNFEYFVKKDKENPRYSFSSLSPLRNLSVYVFTGVGGFYYNPKAEKDGQMYELRPLRTEGQGYTYSILVDQDSVTVQNPDVYGKFALSIPMGVGVKYNLTRSWAITGELSVRYTSTDYLDDASDTYFNYDEAFDNQWITDLDYTAPDVFDTYYENYQLARYFADRHIQLLDPTDPEGVKIEQGSEDWKPDYLYKTGKKFRGSPAFNDAYILFLVKVSYKIRSMGTRRARPKF